MVAIELAGVSKKYRRHTERPLRTTLKSYFLRDLWRRRDDGKDVIWALRDVNLTVEHGTTLGIIGRNGSGKTTVLRLISGILKPDTGMISTTGRLAALIELGAGFHPELTGRENVIINGIILGLTKREIGARLDQIVDFAEVREYIDDPVRTYSSGMYMRLGFSVAVHVEPEILLIDEILAVGDEAFQQKCFEKIAEFRRQGKTIILVSHDLAAVERWGDEAVWLDEGVIRARGMPRRVIDRYRQSLTAREGMAALAEHHRVEDEVQQVPAAQTPNRWGSRDVEIVSVTMVDSSGQERYVYRSGEPARVILGYRVHRRVKEPVFGIAMLRGDGLLCYGSNTEIEGAPLSPLGEEGVVEVLLERLDLIEGTYYLDVAVHAKDGYPYDYHHWLYSFVVKSEIRDVGVFRIPHLWAIKP